MAYTGGDGDEILNLHDALEFFCSENKIKVNDTLHIRWGIWVPKDSVKMEIYINGVLVMTELKSNVTFDEYHNFTYTVDSTILGDSINPEITIQGIGKDSNNGTTCSETLIIPLEINLVQMVIFNHSKIKSILENNFMINAESEGLLSLIQEADQKI